MRAAQTRGAEVASRLLSGKWLADARLPLQIKAADGERFHKLQPRR